MIKQDNEKQFDLEERTAKFGEIIINLCRKIPKDTVTIPIIDQLIRAGTSIGANYCEANGASSKKDFKNKIAICKKETKESKFWLRMLSKTCQKFENDCRTAWREAQELNLIFSKIFGTLNRDI